MSLNWVGKIHYLIYLIKKVFLNSLLLCILGMSSAYAQIDKVIELTQSVKSDFILQHFGTSAAEMQSLNPLVFDKSAKTIEAGTQIIVPEARFNAQSNQSDVFYRVIEVKPVEVTEVNQTFALPELSSEPFTPTEPGAVVASTAIQAGQVDWGNLTSNEVETKLKNLTIEEVETKVQSKIISPLNEYVESQLNTFGYAKAQFQVDREGDFKISQFSILVPVIEDESNLGFTQFNLSEQQNDILVHGGVGYRYSTPSYLLGFNTFVDHNIDKYHTRMSVGAELGMDYVLASTNYYLPISDWKSTKLVEGFETRPAQGYDIRLQGYLPSYSHLGANAVFEQYFGDEVALFNESRRQRNPVSLTLGFDYTPIPLLTAKTSYQLGESSQDELRFGLSMNLRLGEDINKQLDPANVDAMRKYPLNRYEMVDRNYEMVMEYREVPLSHELTIQPLTTLSAQTAYPLRLNYRNNKFPLSEIVGFEQTGGCQSPLLLVNIFNSKGLEGWTIQAPKWFNQPLCDTYYLSAIAKDSQGNTIKSNTIKVVVGYSSLQSQIQVKENISAINDIYLVQADGTDSYQVEIDLLDSQGEKIVFADFNTFKDAIAGSETNYLTLIDSNNSSWVSGKPVILDESYSNGTYRLTLKGSQPTELLRLILDFGHYGQYSAQLRFGTGQVIIEDATVNTTSISLSYYLENIRQEKVVFINNQLPEHSWRVFNADVDITEQVLFNEVYDANTGFYILTAEMPINVARALLMGSYTLKGDFLTYGQVEKPFTLQVDSQYTVNVKLFNPTPVDGILEKNFAGNNSIFTLTAQVFDENNQLVVMPVGEWLLYETNAAGITIGEELHQDPRIKILSEIYNPETNQFEITFTSNQFINLDAQFMLQTGEVGEAISLRFLRDPKNISVVLLHAGADGLAELVDFSNPMIDQYYQLKVLDNTVTPSLDVTAYYASQIRWYYQDVSVGKTFEIARCQGKYMFSTQVSNNANVDVRSNLTNSEQGLRLRAEIDNEYDTAYPETVMRCPDGKYVIE